MVQHGGQCILVQRPMQFFLLGAWPSWQLEGSARVIGCRQGQWKQKGFGLEVVKCIKAPEGFFLFVSWYKVYPSVTHVERILCTLHTEEGAAALFLNPALLLLMAMRESIKNATLHSQCCYP